MIVPGQIRSLVTVKPSVYSYVVILGTLLFVFLCSSLTSARSSPGQKDTVKQMHDEIVRLGLHNVYVPDFLDTKGKRTIAGCYLAAKFSFALKANAKGKEFDVIGRYPVHNYLTKTAQSDADLARPDVFAKWTSEFHPDGILWGTTSPMQDKVVIDLVLRDVSGKELFRSRYEDDVTSFVQGFIKTPSTQDGVNPVFAGLDGYTVPACEYCPDPTYTDEARRRHLNGTVTLAVVISDSGKAEEISLVTGIEPDLNQNSIDAVRKWRFQPAKDPTGKPVKISVPVEVTFKMN